MEAFPDDEMEAVAELGRRRDALVRQTVILSTLAGIGASVMLFAVAYGLGLMPLVGSLKVMSFVGSAVALGMAIKGSAWIVRRRLARVTPLWVDELAVKYKMDRRQLEEITSVWK